MGRSAVSEFEASRVFSLLQHLKKMFSPRVAKNILEVVNSASRQFSTSQQQNVKVAVMGASGGIGQPLSLLLKQSPMVSELSLYDIVHTVGVGADLSHIETKAKVTGYAGNDNLEASLKGCDVVIIPAGVPRKPGMTRMICSTQMRLLSEISLLLRQKFAQMPF